MNTILKVTGTLLIVFFTVLPVQASSPKITWQTGHLQFWDKTVLEGDLSYNWAAEMVSLRQPDGRIHTYSANQVSEFGWFDYSLHKQRDFISLVKHLDKDRDSQAFFEVCMDGSLAVVRKLRTRHGFLKRAFSHPVYSNDKPTLIQNTDHFDYFVYDAGRLLALDRYYIDIYDPLMRGYEREIRQYVLSHNIDDRTLTGRLVLIDHYNWLIQHDTKAASVKEPVQVAN